MLLSRQEAKLAGLVHYRDGVPCKHGHTESRYVLTGKCCVCAKQSVIRWRTANPDTARISMLNGNRKYLGYPKPSYEAPGYCEICGITDSGKNDWNLDHNHVTGAFRGWLCSRCNGAIGMLKDDPDLLDKAAAYLRSR